MRKVMKYDEFKEYLSGLIEEPKSVKDEFLSQIVRPADDVSFFVDFEQDGTIKANVTHSNMMEIDNYIIKINQDTRKYSLFSEKTYTDGIRLDTKSFEKNKFELRYTDKAWNRQQGYVIDSEERTSNFIRQNGASDGKIEDYMWETQRFFDENGIEMLKRETKTEYPDRENEYKFSFGLPEFNFRTPIEFVKNVTFRDSIATSVRHCVVEDFSGHVKKNETYHYLLDYEHGRLPLLKSKLLVNEPSKERYSNCSVEELNPVLLELVEEPMRSGLLERYGIVDNNSRGRR